MLYVFVAKGRNTYQIAFSLGRRPVHRTIDIETFGVWLRTALPRDFDGIWPSENGHIRRNGRREVILGRDRYSLRWLALGIGIAAVIKSGDCISISDAVFS